MITHETCANARWLFGIYIGPTGIVDSHGEQKHFTNGCGVCVHPTEIDRPDVEVDAPGTRLKRDFRSKGAKPCQNCNETAAKMDRMGSEWCRENYDALIAEIRDNISKMPWYKRAAAKLAESSGHVDIEASLMQAISNVDNTRSIACRSRSTLNPN